MFSQSATNNASTTIMRTQWLPGALGQRGCQKIQLCGSESDERTPKQGMNMIKVNETHIYTV